MASIVALTREFTQLNAARTIGIHPVRSCATIAVLDDELARDPPVAIIYEPGFGLDERPDILSTIESRGIPLIARFALLPAAVSEFLTLCRMHPGIAASIRPHDSLDLLARILSEPDTGPVATVLSQVKAAREFEAALPYLVAPLIFGRRRIRGSEHAGAFSIQPRTLESQHHKLGLPEPRRMRMWGGALWALWRLDHWGWPPKRAAAAAEFSTASALSDALGSVLRTAPDKHSAIDRFAWAVNAFRQELSRLTPPGPAPQENVL